MPWRPTVTSTADFQRPLSSIGGKKKTSQDCRAANLVILSHSDNGIQCRVGVCWGDNGIQFLPHRSHPAVYGGRLKHFNPNPKARGISSDCYNGKGIESLMLDRYCVWRLYLFWSHDWSALWLIRSMFA